MNVVDLIPYIFERLILLMLIFTRISAFFSTFVFFRREFISTRIMVALAAILSFYVVLFEQTTNIPHDVFSLSMVMQELFQFFIGFISGFILNIVFEIFIALGQIISTQIGLSLASLIDPRLGNVTNLTQFYLFSITIVFLSLNGHLQVIKTVVESFNTLPVGRYFFPDQLIKGVLDYSKVIFSGSIALSLTIMLAILITNFAIALMTRFAPQFNIFSIGINITLLLGLFCVYFTFNLFVDKGAVFLQESMSFLQSSLRKLS